MNPASVMAVAVLLAVAVGVTNAEGNREDMFLKLVRQRFCRDGLCSTTVDKKHSVPEALPKSRQQKKCMSWSCGKRALSSIDDSESGKQSAERGIPKREVNDIDKTRSQPSQKRKCISWGCHGKRLVDASRNSVLTKNNKRNNLRELVRAETRRSRKLSDMLKKQRDSHYKCLSWDCSKRTADSPVDIGLSEDKRTTDFSRRMDDEVSRKFKDFLLRRRQPLRKWAEWYPEY